MAGKKTINGIIHYITHGIWVTKEHEYRSRHVRWAVRQAKVLLYTAQGFGQHAILVRSAALTFYTLMSLVPIAALVFAIAKGFGLETRLNEYLYVQFPQYRVVIDQVIDFANNMLQRTRGGWIASVGIVVLFWAVVKVFGNVESAFNHIWEVRRARSLPRKFSDYTTVIVVTPILWLISMSIGLHIRQQLLYYTSTPVVNILLGAASTVMIWLMFAFIYLVMPNTKVRLRSALSGGVVAGSVFLIFQLIYIYIQSKLTSYNAIYGSFAAVPLLLIWLQNSWQIVLFGAELSFAYQNIGKFEYEQVSKEMSYNYHKKAMLAVMQQIVRHFVREEGAVSPEAVAKDMNLPVRVVRDAVFDLEKTGLIAPVAQRNDKENRYIPARDVHTIRISDVIEAVESYGKESLDMQRSPEFDEIDGILGAMDRTLRESPQNVLLMNIPAECDRTSCP